MDDAVNLETRRVYGTVYVRLSDVISMIRTQSLIRRGIFPDGDVDLDFMADQLQTILETHK